MESGKISEEFDLSRSLPVDQDKASVIQRLEAYKLRIDEIMTLLEGTLPLRGEAREQAQSLLKSLKADLGDERERMSTVHGQAALSDIERSHYASVIGKAYTEIQVTINSIPNDKWHNDLYRARFPMIQMLHDLRGDFK
jgi:hypothetical protein